MRVTHIECNICREDEVNSEGIIGIAFGIDSGEWEECISGDTDVHICKHCLNELMVFGKMIGVKNKTEN